MSPIGHTLMCHLYTARQAVSGEVCHQLPVTNAMASLVGTVRECEQPAEHKVAAILSTLRLIAN